MPIIDEQGRVFGRFNLVDAAAVLLIIIMVPVTYAAYLLVRDPTPELTGISPKVLTQGPALQIEVLGRSLRPYMRVSFGAFQGRAFYFRGPTQAIVELPDLPPGKYDVVLYDYAQEVSRLKNALTIDGPPQPASITVTVGGAFTDLTQEQAAKLTAKYQLPETGSPTATILDVDRTQPSTAAIRAGNEVLKVPQPHKLELPATLSLVCYLVVGGDGLMRCLAGGVPLGPDVNVPLPGLNTTLNFKVSDVHIPGRSSDAVVRVQFTPRAGVREHVAVGDRDIGAKASSNGVMATIESLSGTATELNAVLRVQVEEVPTGWTYKGHPVRVGADFTFDTARYTMAGWITGVDLPGAGK